MIENFADLWETVADHLGKRPAVIQGEVVRSWAEFEARASRVAGAMQSFGVGPGDRVAIDLWNCPENLEIIFAAFKLRAVPFNINYRYRERELAYLLRDAQPAVVFFDASLASRVRAARMIAGSDARLVAVHREKPGDDELEDLATLVATAGPAERRARRGADEFIIYTGGTTGNPKGVVWGHDALLPARLPQRDGAPPETVEEYLALVRESRPPVRLITSPLMHGTGVLTAMTALSEAGTVVLCASRSLDAGEIVELVERHRVSAFSVVGDAIARPILEVLDAARAAGRPRDLSSVRTINNTGAFWSAEVKRGFLRHGSFTIVDGVNASEAAGFAIAEARTDEEVETARFRLGPHARVITADGRDVVPGSGEAGFLATTGRLPKGYLNDPERTARTWPVIGGVRYSVPGDMATIEVDGTVTLLGRSSEVVNTGGEKVFVEEVENVIASHPEVADVLVIGLADERWGSRVTAVVQRRAGASIDAQAVIDHVGAALADYKRPRQVVFVEQVPRSPSGKADRGEARRLAEHALDPGR